MDRLVYYTLTDERKGFVATITTRQDYEGGMVGNITEMAPYPIDTVLSGVQVKEI